MPGISGLSSGATDVISNLLKGQPSTSTSRRANAYFGAGSGMPNSDFVRNRGFDLYNREGEERKQTGIKDFLSLLGAYTPLAGQEQQGNQFDERLGFDKGQAAINNAQDAQKLALERSVRLPKKKEYSSAFIPADGGQPQYKYKFYA